MTISKRMWHLRSNYKTSFLWLLVSPRKSLQARLLKLNLLRNQNCPRFHRFHHMIFSTSNVLVCQPTSCSSASPMQCLKSLGVPLWGVYSYRCNLYRWVLLWFLVDPISEELSFVNFFLTCSQPFSFAWHFFSMQSHFREFLELPKCDCFKDAMIYDPLQMNVWRGSGY